MRPEARLAGCELIQRLGVIAGLSWSYPTRDLIEDLVPDNGVAQPHRDRLAVDTYDADRVVALDPPLKGAHGEFLRNPDGSIAWFRWGGRIARRQSP
jgi:hypothetical protein